MQQPRIGDAWGAVLTDALAGERAAEIVERDDGFVLSYDARYLLAPFAKWDDANERRAMRFVRGRVLDVGCGGGRVCLHLQERGLDVVGIDSSPGAIECCRRRGVRDARRVALEDVDTSLGRFETVVMLGQNFGMVRSAVRARRVLRQLAGVTSARGSFTALQVPRLTASRAAVRASAKVLRVAVKQARQ